MKSTFAQSVEKTQKTCRRFGVFEHLPKLKAAGIQKRRTLLGGSHSVVTYPPLFALENKVPSAIYDTIGKQDTNLYIHIPFCETRCTFCHYVVSLYKGAAKDTSGNTNAVARYLEALNKEISWYGNILKKRAGTVTSLYIGGGTPLILSTQQLHDLINSIKKTFRLSTQYELCVEASPLTIVANNGREKLNALKKLGVTRLSFGIQSFDDEVLRVAGRGYSGAVATEACAVAGSYFNNWNIDLIQSLYKGGLEEIYTNLQHIDQLRPPHVTWYNGRFATDKLQGILRVHALHKNDFESDEQTILGRMMIASELSAMGYTQIDGNRFVLNTLYEDPFKKIRTSASSDLIGIGVSSYSHTNGWFFRNECAINKYVSILENESFHPPLAQSFNMSPEEKFAAFYVTKLRNGIDMNQEATMKASCKDSPKILAYYDALIQKLICLSLLSVDKKKGTIAVTILGRLFEDELLALFYSPDVQRKLTKKK